MIGAAVLRGAIALLAVADLWFFVFALHAARAAALADGLALGRFDDWLSRGGASAAIAMAGSLGAARFGWRAGRPWGGLLALAALTLLSTAHAHLFGTPWRHLFYSGLCLAGWLLGAAVGRRRGAADDESYAYTGSLALLGAAYANAGISKLMFGGLDWISALPIQAAIIAQDGLVGDTWLSSYRSWAVTTPLVASAFAVATLGFELAGPLMLLGRWPRRVVAFGLIAMHVNIYLLTPILYWESIVLLLLFGLSADPAEGAAAAPAATAPAAPHARRFAAAAALLALCAVVAIAHQRRRWIGARAAARASAPAVAAVAPPSAPAPATPRLNRVGPFEVGQSVAAGWSVETVELRGEGIVVTLADERGSAAFEITCAASPHRSPFDLDAAHIFYSSDRRFPELEGAGAAVRERVRGAAGADVCASLRAWRAGADPPSRERAR